jgi:aryl-alcohol dehydrogenase-like predicted oxidoreductase
MGLLIMIGVGKMPAEQVKRLSLFNNIEMGIGTWSWGDRIFWGYGVGYKEADLEEAFKYCLASGVTFFDTAETYGQGQSEILLGKFSNQTPQPIQIATKFMPFPWRFNKRSLMRALKDSLHRLGRSQTELYQIHWPLPPVNIETWMEAMVDANQAGLIGSVGVSNFDRNRMQRAYDTLIRHGTRLASNQVEFNLINREIEKNGLLEHCQSLGVAVIAYSPIAMGVLSGKYTIENLPNGVRGRKYSRKVIERVKPLITLLKKIGIIHDGKTPAQVALNWVICKGAIPIPGVKNSVQAEQNLGAIGWRLSDEEIALLDEESDKFSKTP